jgi:hypothetical protein
MFATLEDQLCNWVPGEGFPSPNELDACTWALTELLLSGGHLPALDLSRALDLGKRSFLDAGQVAARRQRFPIAAPRAEGGSIEDAVRRRWGVSGYDEYDDV